MVFTVDGFEKNMVIFFLACCNIKPSASCHSQLYFLKLGLYSGLSGTNFICAVTRMGVGMSRYTSIDDNCDI